MHSIPHLDALTSSVSSQQLVQGKVESLTLPISLQVVWCSPRLLYVVDGADFFDDFSLKGSTMI